MSALLMFEFGPSCIELIHGFSRIIQLQGSAVKPGTIAHNGGILQRRLPLMKRVFRLGDALFHALEFAGLLVRELLFPCCGLSRLLTLSSGSDLLGKVGLVP